MKFTVVVPTFKRPHLLRVALESIQSQTALSLIEKVIVSENGLDRSSGDVCLEFSQLPIEYIYQEEQLSVQKHMKWILSQEENNFVALLCDDDWWDIHHLSLAAESLRKHRHCVAYFSNFAYVTSLNIITEDIKYNGTKVLHLNQEKFVNYKPAVYSASQIFLFSFLITPFHFSAMVCRGDVLIKSAITFDNAHPTFADRVLYPMISTFGEVIFNPLKTALILYHEIMDSRNYDAEEWNNERQNGSMQIAEIAKVNSVSLQDVVNNSYIKGTASDKIFIEQEIAGTFYNRDEISWFAGIAKIKDTDMKKIANNSKSENRNSYLSKVINIVKRFV